QPFALVEGARGVRAGQGPGQALEEQADRRRAEAPACLAQGGAVGVPVLRHQAAGGLEDLADGQLGEDTHGQDQPAADLEGQGATPRVEAAGVAEGLQHLPSGDNLFQKQQPVEHSAGLPGWQGAFPLLTLLLRLHRGLLGLGSSANPRLREAATYGYRQRYWG